MTTYQALLSDGCILETDTFASMYRFALHAAKGEVHFGAETPYLVRLCIAEYSEYEIMNQYGYKQRDLLDRQTIGFLAVDKTGYTVEYGHGIYEIEKGA